MKKFQNLGLSYMGDHECRGSAHPIPLGGGAPPGNNSLGLCPGAIVFDRQSNKSMFYYKGRHMTINV